MKTLAGVVIGIFALLSVAVRCNGNGSNNRYSADNTIVNSASILPRPHPLPAPDCKLSSDESIANCVFEQLSHATVLWTGADAKNLPTWTTWDDKCDLGIGACLEGSDKLLTRPSSDLLAIDLPIQIIQSNKRGRGRVQTPIHELASVLFSPEISPTAQSLNNKAALDIQLNAAVNEIGSAREIPSDIIPENSIVTKLIWEVVVDSTDTGIPTKVPAHVYDELNPDFVSGTRQLQSPIGWPSRYLIDAHEDKPCADTAENPNQSPLPSFTKSQPPPTISVNCFFHYRVDSTNAVIWRQLSLGSQAGVVSGIPAEAKSAVLILVGAHFMRFDKNHPAWQWMTFYWTKDPNNQTAWKNPWRHYHMKTASAPQDLGTLTPGIVANPYLEGFVDKNGTDTNCASCHSLAAYSPCRSKLDDAIANWVDTTPDYPETETAAASAGYFDNSVRTHFLWSLATNPNLVATRLATMGVVKRLNRRIMLRRQPTRREECSAINSLEFHAAAYILRHKCSAPNTRGSSNKLCRPALSAAPPKRIHPDLFSEVS